MCHLIVSNLIKVPFIVLRKQFQKHLDGKSSHGFVKMSKGQCHIKYRRYVLNDVHSITKPHDG